MPLIYLFIRKWCKLTYQTMHGLILSFFFLCDNCHQYTYSIYLSMTDKRCRQTHNYSIAINFKVGEKQMEEISFTGYLIIEYAIRFIRINSQRLFSNFVKMILFQKQYWKPPRQCSEI